MELIKWDNARNAIAECKTIDEVKTIRDKAEAMRAYAKQVKESLQVQNDLCEIKLRAERRAGEMLSETNLNSTAKLKNESNSMSLSRIGIQKHESSRWQKIAKIPEETFESVITETKAAAEELTESMMLKVEKEINSKAHVSYNTGFYEWYTPKNIIDAVRDCMGSIDIDPASCEEANKIVQANKIYTEQNNGLTKDWHGNIFLNPPYENKLITDFADKLIIEYNNQNVINACVIVNNATETKWFNIFIEEANAICFPKGRVKFYDATKGRGSAPLQGQAIIYYGTNIERFKESFKNIGFVVRII